jgi:dienelactone hydrolase
VRATKKRSPLGPAFRRLLCSSVVAYTALGTANYSYADEMVQVAAHRTDLSLTPSSHPLVGYLARPDGAGRHSAVVELHGCNGFGTWDTVTADVLKSSGYVGLVLDSLENSNACGSGPFGAMAEALDAYSAIDWLARQSFVDPDRIAVLGFSMGGSAALIAIERGLIEQLHPRHFAAAIAYYPRCHERTGVMTASTLILIGAEDDWTLASWCRDMMTRREGQGASVTLTVYPGATHAFNLPYPPRRYLGHPLKYDPASAADAWERVRGFLHGTLQLAKPFGAPAAGVR